MKEAALDDEIPGDEFDWDQSRDDQHCEHGTFIGSWWGPDILCWACEEGITPEEFAEYQETMRRREIRRWAQCQMVDDLVRIIPTFRSVREPELFSAWIARMFNAVKVADIEDLERYTKVAA